MKIIFKKECEEFNAKKVINYHSLREGLFVPYGDNKSWPNPIDFSKIGRNELLHCGIMTLHEFYDTHKNSLPQLNDSKMVKEILEISLEIYNNAKNLKQK